MGKRNNEQYLSGKDLEENLCIHPDVIGNNPQIAALDEAKLSFHDSKVGHGLWGLLTLQIFNQLGETALNVSQEIFGNLRKDFH